MAWRDTAALLRQVRSAPTYRPSFGDGTSFQTSGSFSGRRPTVGRRQAGINWADLASGRLATSRPVAGDANPLQGGVQTKGLERFDVALPYSGTVARGSYAPQPPPEPRKPDDVVGHLSDAAGDVGLTLGNFLPYFHSQLGKAAHELANANLGPLSTMALAGTSAVDAFLAVNEAASNAIAPVMNAVPDWNKQAQTNSRAKLYRSILNGDVDAGAFWLSSMSSPLAAIGQFGGLMTNPSRYALEQQQLGQAYNPLAPLVGRTVSDEAAEAAKWQGELLHAVDPQKRLTAEQRLGLLRDTINLPESVKRAIQANPSMDDDAIGKLVDSIPAEERRWYYGEDKLRGLTENMGNDLTWWLAEFAATRGALGAVARAPTIVAGTAERAALQATVSQVATGAAERSLAKAALSATVPRAGLAARTATGTLWASSKAVKLNTAAAAAGLGVTGVHTAADAWARISGDEAGVQFWDDALKTTPYAENPNVQLVTSFAVNPAQVLKYAKLGIVMTRRGAVEIPLDVATRGRLLAHFTSEDVLRERLGLMWGVSRPEVDGYLAANPKFYAMRHDYVMNTGLDAVVDRMPEAERAAFNATHWGDPKGYSEAVVRDHVDDALRLWEKEPRTIAARVRTNDWDYKGGLAGPFNPQVAIEHAVANRRWAEISAGIRDETGTVLGYRESFTEGAQNYARTFLDDVTVDGMVPRDDFLRLQTKIPYLREHWAGILKREAGPIPRAKADEVLESAKQTWEASTAARNPVRFKSGKEPILRARDGAVAEAEATGTTVETIEAIRKGDATKVDLMRTYLIDIGQLDAANVGVMRPETVLERSLQFLDEQVRPWREKGRMADYAEDALNRLQAELAGYHALPKNAPGRAGAIAEVEQQIVAVRMLTDAAIEPLSPFSRMVELARADVRFSQRVAKWRKGNLTDAQKLDLHDYLASSGMSVEGTADDWLARVREATKPKVGPALDAELKQMATEIMEARVALRELSAVDDMLEQLGAHGNATGSEMAGMFQNVEGGFQFTGRGALSTAFRARLAKGYRNIGEGGKAASVNDMGVDKLWDDLLGHKERATLLEALTPAQRKMVDRVAAAGQRAAGADEWAAGAKARVEGGDQEWKESVAKLLERRAAILDGRGAAELWRVAARGERLPPGYVSEIKDAADAMAFGWEPDEKVWAEAVVRLQAGLDLMVEHPSAETRAVVRDIVEGDDILRATLDRDETWQAATGAMDPWDPAAGGFAVSPTYHESMAGLIRRVLVPEDFDPARYLGAAEAQTPLDEALRSLDRATIETELSKAQAAAKQARPVTLSRADAATVVEMRPVGARARGYAVKFATREPDVLRSEPNPAILADPANRTGLDALSLLEYGLPGRNLPTIETVLEQLRSIGSGEASRLGIGKAFQAEAERVARLILDDALKGSPRTDLEGLDYVGRFLHGFWPDDAAAIAKGLDALIDVGGVAGDEFTYGLSKAPLRSKMPVDWTRVGGLAEELMEKRYQPWTERVGTVHLRHAFNRVFGPSSNHAIRAEALNRFSDRVAAQGVSPATTKAVFDDWRVEAHDSRGVFTKRDADGRIRLTQGGQPLYADVPNLPGRKLNAMALGALGRIEPGTLQRLRGAGQISDAEFAAAQKVDFAREFRLATSFTRRTLTDSKVPLGKALGEAYGMVMHNSLATTLYYQFRFALDVRYHAMNYLEAQILYAGRAGARKGEIDEAMLLGHSPEGYLRNMDVDPMSSTGYNFSADRFAWMYRTLLKEQPDMLRRALKGIRTEDAEGFKRAVEQLVKADPQLKDMAAILEVDDQTFMKALDSWHKKMLDNVDGTADIKVIDDELAAAMRDSPELADVFGRLGEANKNLWDDIRQTFYGNPNRSQAERFLNSYLLLWPLSYQIKVTKWWLNILFDRVGGLKTNALGAFAVNEVADRHNQLLATDAEYADWFKKHRTLVFLAQQMFPLSFDQMGVSLSPIMRGLFFGAQKDFLDIGPFYTNSLRKQVGAEGYVDLYPTLKDYPPLDAAFRMLFDQPETKEAKAAKPPAGQESGVDLYPFDEPTK